MEFARITQALDGGEGTSADLGGKSDAAWARNTIDEYGASAALTCFTAVFDAVISCLPQRCQKGFVGSNVQAFNDAVDTQFEFHSYCLSFDETIVRQREILVASSSARNARFMPLMRR